MKNVNKDTPFWDERLTNEERIDWLLKAMTIEEKLSYIASGNPDLERLGIPGISVGGEAAHGVEQRNDQNGIGDPDVTTSFPQPFGMSMSFDPELIEKAGEVTGKEARVISHRHEHYGLSRWAPTVDLERDPRWGRNEEGYGEDPVLTGAMAGAYIQGMQGNDKKYLRIASTLKHFYGNNTEVGRGWKNSSIDPRNKYEYYLEPFRRCIENAGAEGIMTAYNRINGTIGILNPEVQTILKNQHGLTHAVSDGGATSLVVTLHHEYGMHAETVAAALKAGVDAMSDNPAMVEEAARNAYQLGLLTEEDLNTSIRNMMRTKLRLGVYDRHNRNPYDQVTEADIDNEENRKVCLELTRNSVVLLKNEENFLPLSPQMNADDLALIGPMADAWYQDWYGGKAPYRTTLKEGIQKILPGLTMADGLDRVALYCQGKGLALDADYRLCLSEEPDLFIKECHGEGSYTFRHVSSGRYLGVRSLEGDSKEYGLIAADRQEAFDWFVTEIMHIEEKENGEIILTNRFHSPIYLTEDGLFASMAEREGTPLTVKTVENGIEKAVALAKSRKVVLLALGCHSMINAKEEIDRNTLALPEDQELLLKKIAEVNPNTALILFTNYPYSIRTAKEKLPAILLSATGSQDMGTAMAESIFGISAPAGRLNMTWYESEDQLPSIDDYDIIKGKRTYRYFDGDVLYPFGYGLTYTDFAYRQLKVELKDQKTLQITVQIENTGKQMSDEVVQIYAVAPASRVKKPISQLIGFKREKKIAPSESREVRLEIPVEELRFYDTVSARLMVEEGTYLIYAGRSCKDQALKTEVKISGEKTGSRNLSERIRADHYDDYENMVITKGHLGFPGMQIADQEKEGILIYRDCDLSDPYTRLSLLFQSKDGCEITVFADGKEIGSFKGDSRTNEQKSSPVLDKGEITKADRMARIASRNPIFDEIDLPLSLEPGQAGKTSTLEIHLKGDICLCTLQMKMSGVKGKIQLGVAN